MSRSANFSVLGLRAAALIAAVVSGTGCAESIGDIDRTQPDLIAKDNFQGQWFIRESVVDVPPTSPATFVGENGSLETIVWDIQQNYLVGYRAYQEVPGLDGTAQSQLAQPSSQPVTTGQGQGRSPTVYKGNPVVAYHIDQHVDVQRGYNPRTGEQNNIISENSTDRPWYERAFMRVDWSRNDVNNFLTTPQPFWPIFGESSSVTDYIPANEGGPDAFHVETDENGLANYIDFTVRETMQPNIFGCSAMMNSELGDCTGEEIKMRTSLLKVDPAAEQEYVPLVYDDRREGEFGYFRVERPTYDRRLGETFTGLIQLAGRHDVWSKSRDASGEPLDYAARTLKPIKYALSEHFPDNLRAVADQIGKDYDTATKTVIAATRKENVADLEQDLLNDTGDTCLFCIDTNEDNHARNGDLRYNFVYWVDDLQPAGPLGFGPSSLNPETGRIVSASAYVYGAGVDRYAEQAKEIVELLIGKAQGGLSDDDLVSGDYIRNAVRANLTPVDPRKTVNLTGLSGEALSRKVLGEKGFARAQALAKSGASAIPTAIPGLDASRLQRLVGTPLEALMVPDEWTRAAQAGQTSYLQQRSALLAKQAQALGQPAPAEGPLGYLSVTNWFGPDSLNFQKELEDKASQHSLWLANFDDPAIAGLARDVANMGLAGDDLFQYLRGRIFRSVMLHELGHTLGLRHNFAGSADALNYQDDYWPLRQKSIDPVAAYTQGTTPLVDGFLRSNCSVQGPLQAASDGSAIPGTDVTQACADQENGKMGELQYSSIMDYGSRFNSDIHGLGHYDIAALGAGYGDLVEVFDDTAVQGIAKGSQATQVDVRGAIAFANTVRNPILEQGLDNALAQTSANGLQYGHYQDYPVLFGGYQNIAKRKFIPRTDYLNSLNAAQGNPAQTPVKVPYLSCYDEYVDSVDVCHRWDSGADNYEIVANYVNLYEQYYVFNNFQRDRVGFDPFMVAQRTASRYFLPLTNMYQHWLWGAFITGLAPQGSPRGDLGLVATRQALNLLTNTMSTPEYGPHTYDTTVGEYVPSATACPDPPAAVLVPTDGVLAAGAAPTLMSMPACVDIPRGVGRSYFSRYDSSGYDVFRRVLESGHFYDQLAALQALQQSNASVVGIGQDVQADSRTFRLPWNLLFPDEVGNLFSAIYRQDDTSYAQHIDGPAGTTDPSVVNLSVFTDPATMAALPIVQPGRTYTTRVQALVAGMNLLDGTLNAAFAKQGQISLGGSGEERTAPAGFTLVTATDPSSGRVFVAYRKTDGTDGPWYAADLLDAANKLVNSGTATAGEITSAFGDVELVRLAFGIFGQ